MTDRPATQLEGDGFSASELYFAEDGKDRLILRHGMDGKLVDRGLVMLQAANTDWSLFNNVPEVAKCGALVLYEQMQKPSGVALVQVPLGQGQLTLCTIDPLIATRNANALWRKLFLVMGVKLNAMQADAVEAFNADGILINAMAIGRFGAADFPTALAADYLGPSRCRAGRRSESWRHRLGAGERAEQRPIRPAGDESIRAGRRICGLLQLLDQKPQGNRRSVGRRARCATLLHQLLCG